MQREESGALSQGHGAEGANKQELLRAVHETLDVLESRLGASDQRPAPIDLVLRLRRRIIEMSSECPGDKS